MAKKETTIEELASIVREGFENAEKKTDEKFDKFAVMVQKGLESVTSELKKEIKTKTEGIKDQMASMSKELDSFQRGQERIEDRLDEMASDKKVLKSHEKKIGILENKILLAR